MAKSIGKLKADEQVRLKFHGNKQFGNEPYELDVTFKEYRYNNGETNAFFAYEDGSAADGFEAYKFLGHWCYGSGANRLSIIQK